MAFEILGGDKYHRIVAFHGGTEQVVEMSLPGDEPRIRPRHALRAFRGEAGERCAHRTSPGSNVKTVAVIYKRSTLQTRR
jgi:hypothetical protein